MTEPLDIAYAALVAKGKSHGLFWDYYDGNQPLKYSSERLSELFRDVNCRFVWNWMAAITDAAADRIHLDRFDCGDNKQAEERLTTLMKDTELDLDADDVHLAALVTGESYVMAWKDETGVQAFYNDPRLCYIQYDPKNPRVKAWGAKWWIEEEHYNLDLYYPGEIQYYRSKKAVKNTSSDALGSKLFEQREQPAGNEYGEVPIFHFRRTRRGTISELQNVVTIQDAINKLFSDMMVGAEFSAIKQRVIIGNFDKGNMPKSVGDFMVIPAASKEQQPSDIKEYSASDLKQFLDAIDSLATGAAIITRTPKHYLFQQGGDPSGEALIAMEAPLNRKVSRYNDRFGNTWQRVAAFLLKLEGMEVAPESINPIFESPETSQPKTVADIRKTNVDAGIPLVTTLKWEGYSEKQIQDMQADRNEQGAAQVTSLAAGLVARERGFNSGQGGQ